MFSLKVFLAIIWVVLAARREVASDAVVLAARREVAGDDVVLRLLHHNPHWECFARDPGSCISGHRKLFNGFLSRYDVDFAGLVMGGKYLAPAGYSSISHRSIFDRAEIVWNSKRWTLEESKGTCFRPGRAGLIGRFASKEFSGLKVVVVSLHYAHSGWKNPSRGADLVGEAIRSLMQNETDKVLVLADTNVPAHSLRGKEPMKSSAALLQEFGLNVEITHTTRVLPTCCADWKYWKNRWPKVTPFPFSFDRIFSNFGTEMKTIEDEAYYELTNNYTVAPWWAADVTKLKDINGTSIAAYHHPVLAQLML